MDRPRWKALSLFQQVRYEFRNLSSGLKKPKTCIRIRSYAVTSTTSSVIYFGGSTEQGRIDRVAEFKNFEWTLLGNLVGPRCGHRSIKMRDMIYLFDGDVETYEFFNLS